ncbi:nucleotide sugar dehydrogenase [Pseudonocardia oroxyli]|uniref:Nucleotide sugar dehydrogenase n=1 Tax=Pseudonocardia oroxyli TaxID=366584 RepID=A0A1G7Z805_PSEOR|nr:nucleotide sugar dehydrogenase [Pseudonocardia oroxyli]
MATPHPASREFPYDIAIVGLGYVGLPTALAMHAAGQRVLGLDVSLDRLQAILAGRVDLLASDRERLQASIIASADEFALTDDARLLADARAVVVCVPTPVDAHLVPDLSILRSACAAVVANAVPGQVLILTSTTYVGTTDDLLVHPLAARGLRPGEDIAVAFSPERIDPGNAGHAHEAVPRVVGGATPQCTELAVEVLGGYAEQVHPVSSTGAAELTKLLENTFRAVNIALANEMAEISGALNLDVMEVIAAAATKPYGFMPFYPGPGVGGHCIPCDPHYLLWQLRRRRITSPVIEQAMNGIAARPGRVVDRCVEVLAARGQSIAGARVLVLGTAYKPDVEDVRESPALEILALLAARGAKIAYQDEMIPTLRVEGVGELQSEADPLAFAPDLVIVHTLHGRTEPEWLASAPAILDTTYRVSAGPRVVL